MGLENCAYLWKNPGYAPGSDVTEGKSLFQLDLGIKIKIVAIGVVE